MLDCRAARRWAVRRYTIGDWTVIECLAARRPRAGDWTLLDSTVSPYDGPALLQVEVGSNVQVQIQFRPVSGAPAETLLFPTVTGEPSSLGRDADYAISCWIHQTSIMMTPERSAQPQWRGQGSVMVSWPANLSASAKPMNLNPD